MNTRTAATSGRPSNGSAPSKPSRVLAALAAVIPMALMIMGCGSKLEVPELTVGDHYETVFGDSHLETSDLEAEYGITEAALWEVYNGGYAFQDFSCRWQPFYVDVPDVAHVTVTGNRDYLVICQSPDGDLVGSDDFNVVACLDDGDCDPALSLVGAGQWLCLASVSPFDTVAYEPNDPMGGELILDVNPGTIGFGRSVLVADVVSLIPVGMATVMVAEAPDLTTTLAMATTDEIGSAVLTLDAAVNAPVFIASGPGFTTTYFFNTEPVTGTGERILLYIIDTNNLDQWYQDAVETLDAGEATLAGRVVDSFEQRVAGATVTSTDGLVVYLDANRVPDLTLTETGDTGEFVVLNVTASSATLSADDGTRMGSATVSALADSLVVTGVILK